MSNSSHQAHPRSALIAVVGLAGTGKSTAVSILHDRLGGTLVYFGGIVIEEVKRRKLPVNESNERVVREELRESGGMGAIAEVSLPAIRRALIGSSDVSFVIVDGVYSDQEMTVLRREFGDAVRSLAIHCPRYLREKRVATRPVRPLTSEELMQRDIMEIRALDKATPIALADFHVVNDRDLATLTSDLDDVLKVLLPRRASIHRADSP